MRSPCSHHVDFSLQIYMANEHVLMTQKTFPISMTVANGTGIEKGTLLKLTDPNTAIATSAAQDPVCGIAYTEKIANDGNTQISVLSGPGDELKASASGSITVGDPLVVAAGNAGFNFLQSAVGMLGDLSGSRILGYSKETAVASDTFKYVLNITSVPGGV
mgnify:FL=1